MYKYAIKFFLFDNSTKTIFYQHLDDIIYDLKFDLKKYSMTCHKYYIYFCNKGVNNE